MSIIPVRAEDVELITTVINPERFFKSNSLGEVTGAINLYPRASNIEKEIRPLAIFQQSVFNDENLENYMSQAILNNAQDYSKVVDQYLVKVNEQGASAKKKKSIGIRRFVPTADLTADTLRKLNVKDILIPHYRINYKTANWAYTNYHSLNFFTSPDVPSTSALLFANIDNNNIVTPPGVIGGTYSLSGPFTFECYINPRYKEDYLDPGEFRAGTIFHLSSSYCLSLVTGSLKDQNGYPASFKLQLQLSHSADVPPSEAIPGNYPNDLIFHSDDNILDWNTWNHVVVRWGTNLINDGTGSFYVNGKDSGFFNIPSGTILPKIFDNSDEPTVLFVGNYFEGTNQGTSGMSYFFSDIESEREGLPNLIDSAGTQDEPDSYLLRHPLKAEVHNLAIYRSYKTNLDINNLAGRGLSQETSTTDVAFYLPPFFVEKAPYRKFVTPAAGPATSYGGVLLTPFYEVNGYTSDPFNVGMSFGVGGHYINLDNFVKDFANQNYARLHHLSASVKTTTTTPQVANDILYDDPFVRKRNLTILPCDDGNFNPNYGLIVNEVENKGIDSFGRLNTSLIGLDYLLNDTSILGKFNDYESLPDIYEELLGFNPEYPGLLPGEAIKNKISQINDELYDPSFQKGFPLSIYERTKDPSSNQITFFDISNLFYGSRILPKSFVLKDSNMSGSGGAVSITIKDDGNGNLYRGDSLTPHSKKSSIGNIFYNEGVVFLKSPHINFFGKDQYEMSFRGEYQLHSSKYALLAPSGLLNSSSNGSYAPLKEIISASNDPLDNDLFVYITEINMHDENLNVVAKANLAQPVLKREPEKVLFKVGFDF
jgi:hypothetical protein